MKFWSEIMQHPAVTTLDFGLAKDADGYGGAFEVRTPTGTKLRVVASDGLGWDHVSVSLKSRTPRYQEMKQIKRIFFRPDEWAVEYHPPSADYVSINDNVLHIWRPQGALIPIPPKVLV